LKGGVATGVDSGPKAALGFDKDDGVLFAGAGFLVGSNFRVNSAMISFIEEYAPALDLPDSPFDDRGLDPELAADEFKRGLFLGKDADPNSFAASSTPQTGVSKSGQRLNIGQGASRSFVLRLPMVGQVFVVETARRGFSQACRLPLGQPEEPWSEIRFGRRR